MSKLLCIYHANCADGFGAAWVVRRAFGAVNVDFHPGVYQEPPPDTVGREVLLVDFSYKRAIMDYIIARAEKVTIIDHHKTAIEDLQGIMATCHFDLERSGAGLTWDILFPEQARPTLINVIEDRDLWRFKLPNTREIQAAVFSYPYDFEVWDKLMVERSIPNLHAEGIGIERKHHKDVAELVKTCRRRMLINGVEVWGASLPYTLTSDAGNLMSRGEPFAACYWDTAGGRVFSLRSQPEGADVSEIAKAYGGGGHRNASGFRVPLANIGQFEL